MKLAVLCGVAELNCDTCKPRNNTAREKKRSEELRKERGCYGETGHGFRNTETGEMYYRCPIKLVTRKTWFILSLFSSYEDGYLPYAGGILDQPEYLLRRFDLLSGFKAKQLDNRRKKEERKWQTQKNRQN